MNYYERHIGDYLKDTSHLSLLEHGIYTRLMDVYYTREGPILESEAARLIGARSKDEKAALKAVLAEFFDLVDGCHVQHRCEVEIARFQDKQRKAAASANARWAQHATHTERNANASPNAMRTHSEGNAPRARPQSPVTSNQYPPTPRKRGSVHDFPPGFDRFWEAYPKHTAKPKAAQAFARIKPDDELLRRMLAAIDRQRTSLQWTRDGGQFVPHPSTWLNGRRWEDDPEPSSAGGDQSDIWAGAR